MSNLTILRRYAQKSDPTSLSPPVLFAHTPSTLTVFDAYPKAIFHFLILPRLIPPLTPANSRSLRTLFQSDRNLAKACLEDLNRDARKVRDMIEDEMLKRFGFKWPIWMGFHAVQSMEHLHLHVLSADLCSPSLKHKKHYNSFHPKLGFFLHLHDVLSWLEAESSFFQSMIKLDKSQYEAKLKEPLECFHCEQEMKNIPTLKAHLQEEWDKIAAKYKKSSSNSGTKRRREGTETAGEPSADGARAHKKLDVGQ